MRVQNKSGSEKCRRCDDDALIQVEPDQTIGGIRYEGAYGPCPDCERGQLVEFSGRWGAEGFWARNPYLRQNLGPVGTPVRELSPEEHERVKAELKAFGLRLAAVDPEPRRKPKSVPVDDCPDFGVAA